MTLFKIFDAEVTLDNGEIICENASIREVVRVLAPQVDSGAIGDKDYALAMIAVKLFDGEILQVKHPTHTKGAIY